jgi:iodotyrosine deiodinase
VSDNELDFIDLDFNEMPFEEMKERSLSFYKMMNRRRTTRHFSNKNVERELIEVAIRTASTAPSGAHLQPWTFVVISN